MINNNAESLTDARQPNTICRIGMLAQCWANVADVGPLLGQHKVNVMGLPERLISIICCLQMNSAHVPYGDFHLKPALASGVDSHFHIICAYFRNYSQDRYNMYFFNNPIF